MDKNNGQSVQSIYKVLTLVFHDDTLSCYIIIIIPLSSMLFYILLQHHELKAIEKGDLEAVKSWLAALPDGDAKKTKLNTTEYYDSSRPIHLAAKHNQPEIARALLDEGAGTYVLHCPR